MLFLLRKIRQSLLAEGKVSKYIIYALGEIFLVVIGILIALSIDGWNDARIEAKQEEVYLQRLLSENQQDLATFTQLIVEFRQGMESAQAFSEALKDPEASDSLVVKRTNEYFQYGSIIPVFSSSTSTFEDLSSTGNLHIIRNVSLRDRVVQLYASHQGVKERLEINNQWAHPLDGPFTLDNDIMQFEVNTAHMFPERKLSDMAKELRERRVKFISNAAIHYWINMDAIDQLENLQKATKQLIREIENELNLEMKSSLPDPLAAGWQGESVCEVLQELPNLRILKCTFAPGVGHERHYHPRHIGYTIAGSKMQITDTTGVRVVEAKTGGSFFSEGIAWHEALNVGDSTAVFLIIEPR